MSVFTFRFLFSGLYTVLCLYSSEIYAQDPMENIDNRLYNNVWIYSERGEDGTEMYVKADSLTGRTRGFRFYPNGSMHERHRLILDRCGTSMFMAPYVNSEKAWVVDEQGYIIINPDKRFFSRIKIISVKNNTLKIKWEWDHQAYLHGRKHEEQPTSRNEMKVSRKEL